MKTALIISLLLLGAVIGHDYWYSQEQNLPFAFTDFGWMIQTYTPSVETELKNYLSPEDLSTYIAPLFETETITIAAGISALLLLFGLLKFIFSEKSENSFFNRFRRNQVKQEKFHHNQLTKKKSTSYKRK
tara:strand:- start:103 stop:495 length:393 start_codon:yes stop_codon:yes gene_type:complete